MILSDILNGLSVDILNGDFCIDIKNICYDSRSAIGDSLFVAIKGENFDGADFISDAVNKGAIAVIVSKGVIIKEKNVTVIEVSDTREALAQVAKNFYKNPTDKLTVIGVTGTNGKTTTTTLISTVLNKLGYKTGLIGTIENKIGDRVIDTERTTPESLDLFRLFYEMVNEGVTHVVMEVSSHAVCLKRVYGIDFKIGIFSNLTQDHLDYHETMENYCKAKSDFFKQVDTAIINVDDSYFSYMQHKARIKDITYSINKESNYQAKDVLISATGVTFNVGDERIKLHTPGNFSVYNGLAAFAALKELGEASNVIIKGLEEIEGVKGRFQAYKADNGVVAIVDYAHTPDSLLNVLLTIGEFCTGRIITVFGCGGDRDNTKRPIMGEIAGKHSHISIITSDNPRTENPETIVDEVEVGTKRTSENYKKIVDRKKAIHYALSIAKDKDVVLVAGKGHENYQIIGKTKNHFDDYEIIEEYYKK